MDAAAIRAALAPCPAELVAPDSFWLAIHAGYGQGKVARCYHDFAHVADVAARYGEVARDVGWSRPREVFMAVLFHDIVYEVGAADNEARSAQKARDAVARWFVDAGLDGDYIARLIELTAGHSTIERDAVSMEEALFLDCDMAILGADPATYDRYEINVAAEYEAVYPAIHYRQGRRHFLAGLLARERIYLSDYFHARLDARARANLTRVLAS